MKINPVDKQMVYDWMVIHCKPSGNAKNKEEILLNLKNVVPGLIEHKDKERYLRYVLAALKDENRVGALSSWDDKPKGGYFVPGSHNDAKECRLMVASWCELIGRGLQMLCRARRFITYWREQLVNLEQGQRTMFNFHPIDDKAERMIKDVDIVLKDIAPNDEIGVLVDDIDRAGVL